MEKENSEKSSPQCTLLVSKSFDNFIKLYFVSSVQCPCVEFLMSYYHKFFNVFIFALV